MEHANFSHLFQLFPGLNSSGCDSRSTTGLEEEDDVAAAEFKTAQLVVLVYSVWCMVYGGPLHRTNLLDADGDEGNVTEIGSIHNEDSARLKGLEIRHAALFIAITAFCLIPDDNTSAGMNARDDFLLEHRAVAGRVKAVIIEDIENNVGRLTIREHVSIGTIS